jgi:hypothetical protein
VAFIGALNGLMRATERKQVGIDGNRSRYVAERMFVRVSGCNSINMGGTAGVSSCPMEEIP